MKKALLSFISILTVIVFVCSCDMNSADIKPKKSPAKIYSLIPDVEKDYKGIESYIAKCLRNKQSKIDIFKYGVSIDDFPQVYRSAIFTNPDIFYVDAATFNYDHDKNKIIYYVYPEYIVNKKEISDYIDKFDKAVNDFLKEVDNRQSDLEKGFDYSRQDYLRLRVHVGRRHSLYSIRRAGEWRSRMRGLHQSVQLSAV